MQRNLLLLFVLLAPVAHAQHRAFDKYKTDTFRLEGFSAEKVVAYKVAYVTVYLNYQDYKQAFDTVWERLKDFRPVNPDSIENAEYRKLMLSLIKAHHFIDSIHNLLIEPPGNFDTIYLADKDFRDNNFRAFMDLDKVIEHGNCAIADENNVLQHIIIRQKGSWYKGPLNAFGGRQYFLPGRKDYFYEAMDWIA